MAQRITAQIEFRGHAGGAEVLDVGHGDDLDQAIADLRRGGAISPGAFGQYRLVAFAPQGEDGYAAIVGRWSFTAPAALEAFREAARQYSSGPGWGGGG